MHNPITKKFFLSICLLFFTVLSYSQVEIYNISRHFKIRMPLIEGESIFVDTINNKIDSSRFQIHILEEEIVIKNKDEQHLYYEEIEIYEDSLFTATSYDAQSGDNTKYIVYLYKFKETEDIFIFIINMLTNCGITYEVETSEISENN